MEKFSLARITSDEIQEEELIEIGPRNQSPEGSEEMKLDSNQNASNTEESKHNQKIFRSQDQNVGLKSENKIVSALKRIGSRSKSNLRNKPSETENVKKSKSKLLQSFERLKSLTKIKSRNAMKSSELETKSKDTEQNTEALYNVQTSNNARTSSKKQTSSNAQRTETARKRSIIKIEANEHMNDPKKVSVKISEAELIQQDKGVQYIDVCAKNKCPLDCKNILITQKEQEAAQSEKHLTEKVPEDEKAKAKTKKRCYLIRSKTREKIKSKSLSDLSESQEKKEKEKKIKEAATKTESRKKCGSKRSASQSPKKKKKTPPPSPKRKKSKCYGQKQTQTQKQEESELTEAQRSKEKVSELKVKKDEKEEGKDGKKVKSKKKSNKCYYYRKRPKVDKKPEVPPDQPVVPSAQPPPTPQPTPPPTPPSTPLRTSPASTPKPSKFLTPQTSLHLPPKEKASSSPSILSRTGSLVQPSEEEPTPLTGASTVTVIPSHETFPSSTISIPTISRTTIPTTTEASHETIIVIESKKEIPYTSPSELYTPSDEALPKQKKEEVEEEEGITSPSRRSSCMMAGPPAFICNEDYKFPEFRERLNFSQNRGPIPPCLQPVLGTCEGRRCTILKGGERAQVCGVKYATVKITFFPEYTTYEVMRSTEKPPKCIPKCIEEVFVTKYEPKPQAT